MDDVRLLNSLRSTIGELENIWRSIGLSNLERSEQVEALYGEINELFKNKISLEKNLLENYEIEVEKLKQDIRICAERLDLVLQTGILVTEGPLIRDLTKLRGEYEKLDKLKLEMELKLNDKLNSIHKLWNILSEPQQSGFESVGFKLTTARLNELEYKFEEVKREYEKRKIEIRNRVLEACDLLHLLELDTDVQSSLDAAILNQNIDMLGLGQESLDALEQRTLDLKQEKQIREGNLMKLSLEIVPLWEKLAISKFERDSFANKFSTLGENSIKAHIKELARLKELRKEKYVDLIEFAKKELVTVLTEARIDSTINNALQQILNSPIEKNDPKQCEDLLTSIEREIEKGKLIVEQIRPIVKLCQKYLTSCEERTKYEILIQDPTRLTNRKRTGENGMISLQEEVKMGKRVADIPKMVIQLKQLVNDYQMNNNGTKLILEDIFGESTPVCEFVDKNEREHSNKLEREKEQKGKEKKAALNENSNNATTSSSNSTAVKKVPVKKTILATARVNSNNNH